MPGSPTQPVCLRFLETVDRFPERVALEIGQQHWTYRQLSDLSRSLAATLQRYSADAPRFTGIYAARSAVAYSAVLAALLRGHAYIPLNPADPVPRTRSLLQRTGLRTVILDQKACAPFREVLAGVDAELLVVLPDRPDATYFAGLSSRIRFLTAQDLLAPATWQPQPVTPEDLAYVLFTSGSTGEPKGVTVTHRNVTTLINTLIERHSISETDRISQMAELSFDPSVADLFTAWLTGATVCCPTKRPFIDLPGFIRDSAITVLQIVPSTGKVLQRLGALKPNRFPALRVSLFGGEALPVQLASVWNAAAPNSILENLYGPTECTVDATAYRWTEERGRADSENGVVAIGELLPGFKALVVDEHLIEVEPGEKGELLLSGPQLAAGYFADPERTARSFITPPGRSGRFYRTGDLVRKPRNGKPFTFLGRLDDQVKFYGLRIELGEIEAALREASGLMDVAAVGWPIRDTGVGGIVGFLGSESADPAKVHQCLLGILPAPMVPTEIRLLQCLPLNANGKVDRKQLLAILGA
jgi:amino acid adenylation domain-containing protein